MSNSKKILATGDDFSLVKLFKYPCTVEKAKYREFTGHSSHVCKIRFSKFDKFLISVGGNDKCVFIWETDFAMEGAGNSKQDEDFNEKQDEKQDEANEFNDEEEEVKPKKKVAKKKVESEPEEA